MSDNNKLNNWHRFLKFYCAENIMRPTRLGVFEDGNDLWIEDGLVLQGIDLDLRNPTPTVEIMLDGYSHTINDVREMKVSFSTIANNDGLDFIELNGTTTILRFENW
jgi:hypothetical protein